MPSTLDSGHSVLLNFKARNAQVALACHLTALGEVAVVKQCVVVVGGHYKRNPLLARMVSFVEWLPLFHVIIRVPLPPAGMPLYDEVMLAFYRLLHCQTPIAENVSSLLCKTVRIS